MNSTQKKVFQELKAKYGNATSEKHPIWSDQVYIFVTDKNEKEFRYTVMANGKTTVFPK